VTFLIVTMLTISMLVFIFLDGHILLCISQVSAMLRATLQQKVRDTVFALTHDK